VPVSDLGGRKSIWTIQNPVALIPRVSLPQQEERKGGVFI